jgi:hypothetical protein
MEIHFEIQTSMPFDNQQMYIVGYDTLGDGVRFDHNTVICHNNEDLNSEIHRIIEEYDLYESSIIPIEEKIVIAEIKTTPNLNYKQYKLTKRYL